MKNLSVLCVTYKDKELISYLIRSFEKFKPKNINIQYVIIENTMNSKHKHAVESLAEDVVYINVPFGEKNSIQGGNSSLGHGMAYEEGKKHINNKWAFICHSDCLITSKAFFKNIEQKINEGYELIGVCKDAHPARVDAIHCSGYMVKNDILQQVSLLPILPKIDTTDQVTIFCRENNKNIFCFNNTYNDKKLCTTINEPFKSLGQDCGVDRCIGLDDHEVIYIHQGRGTSKLLNSYHKPGKINTHTWINLCKYILGENK